MIAGRRFNTSIPSSEWHNYELDLQLVLDLNNASRDADRINAKISLFDCCTARIGSLSITHVRLDRSALTVQRQLAGDNPSVDSGPSDLRRMKADERIAFTLQDLRMHGVLDFRLLLRAQFVVLDKRELAGINGKGYLQRIAVIDAASRKWCRHPMIVARCGEQAGLPYVNLQRAVFDIDRPIGGS